MASRRRREAATQARAMCMVIPRQLGDTDPELYVRATFLKVPYLSHNPLTASYRIRITETCMPRLMLILVTLF